MTVSSHARIVLSENLRDVDRLLALHTTVGGTSRGRRWNVQCLNKGAIVLICGAWEAFLEDVCDEGTRYLLSNKPPAGLGVQPAAIWSKAFRATPQPSVDKIAIDIADAMWNGQCFSTPNASKARGLFERAFGIPDITASWYWPGSSHSMSTTRLREYMDLRHGTVHRSEASKYVRRPTCVQFRDLVCRLADLVENDLGTHCQNHGGARPF